LANHRKGKAGCTVKLLKVIDSKCSAINSWVWSFARYYLSISFSLYILCILPTL